MRDEPLVTQSERYLDDTIKIWLKIHENPNLNFTLVREDKPEAKTSKEELQYLVSLSVARSIGLL